MSGMDLDSVMDRLLKKGFDEVALESIENSMEQVRFSRNSKDLYNNWSEKSLFIFASQGRKTVNTVIKDVARVDESIDKLWKLSRNIPDNPSYEGINSSVQEYGARREFPTLDADLHDLSMAMINAALDAGAERTAGVMYNKRHRTTIKTNYNECSFEGGGLETLIRSFKGDATGQEGRHIGLAGSIDSRTVESIGRDSAEPLRYGGSPVGIEPGKFNVLMSPYVIGNLITYSSEFLSYYSVETGLSCFSDSMGKNVSSEGFSLVDDPLDANGVGYRICDDEGTPARKNTLIEDGILKSFMHSYSTARRAGTETTGNAGILSPRAWQLKILPGSSGTEQILSEMDEGLYIRNCWYTRYQDYRNGVFSTVPRDGVFYVKNGEIAGTVKGIRISDSIPNVLANVDQISSDTKYAKWWEEVAATNMPSVHVTGVNISRGF